MVYLIVDKFVKWAQYAKKLGQNSHELTKLQEGLLMCQLKQFFD